MLFTIKDLSARLNIKPSTLYLWAAQGKIPCRKIHGLIRFEPDAMPPGCVHLSQAPSTAVPPLTRRLIPMWTS